jgi:hypothetical protein
MISPASNQSSRESFKRVTIYPIRLYSGLRAVIEMARKLFAIIGAFIGGGLGIAVLGTQAAHAGVLMN